MTINKSYTSSLFTKRQLEVLTLLSQGYSNGSIAKKLVLGTKSIENYINAIYQILFPSITRNERDKIHLRVLSANYFNVSSSEMPLLIEKFRALEEEIRVFQIRLIQENVDNMIKKLDNIE